MTMSTAPCILGIDLGSTNVKAVLYDKSLHEIDSYSFSVDYIKVDDIVEFCLSKYKNELFALLSYFSNYKIAKIVLTGQAETLVLLDQNKQPIGNAISWMDNRSTDECKLLSKSYSPQDIYGKTGQTAIIPTWPATKIMHLKRHSETFSNISLFVMLKDYVAYLLTDHLVADRSIATFTLYFDIFQGQYWQDMLTNIGIEEDMLPPLVDPCLTIGTVNESTSQILKQEGTSINIGTLDHFAGLIGSGKTKAGVITESTGTVMALSAFANANPSSENVGVALHYGPFPTTFVYIAVVESGGLCLEWFMKEFTESLTFGDLEGLLSSKDEDDSLVFLPYLTGTNAPEFDKNAVGMFYGIAEQHDRIDFAKSIMEGLAFVLEKNVRWFESHSDLVHTIVSTGGGTKSTVWNQIKADITGKTVLVPKRDNIACFGAAIIGAVELGWFSSHDDALASSCQYTSYIPQDTARYSKKQAIFNQAYDFMIKTQATRSAQS